MGSTGIYTTRSFSEVLGDEMNTNGYQILKSHMEHEPVCNKGELDSAVAYCAVRHPKGYVFGLVVTFTRMETKQSRCEEEVIFKLIDESEGPCYNNCPMNILSMLSPIPDDQEHIWANRWRDRCKSNNAISRPV
jgi:hypothetical protein